MDHKQRTLGRLNARVLSIDETERVTGGAYVTSTLYTVSYDVYSTYDSGTKPVLPDPTNN